jgi:hypothetical protein
MTTPFSAAANDAEEEEDEEKARPQQLGGEPLEDDIIGGRGAAVNGRKGNMRFRALCFARKLEFEAGNHAAKRRIATEIVMTVTRQHQSRFFKKVSDSVWEEMTMEASIQKACQVMRDYQRPDRVATKEESNSNNNTSSTNNKRKHAVHQEEEEVARIVAEIPAQPYVENPQGVTANDILSGRGAFVNGHVGNQRLRRLAQERKVAFDSGNFCEKQALASEIVAEIRAVGGRFLKRKTVDKNDPNLPAEEEQWEELSDDKALHKACQVMRDISKFKSQHLFVIVMQCSFIHPRYSLSTDRPDRLERSNSKKEKRSLKNDSDVSIPVGESPPPLPALELQKPKTTRGRAKKEKSISDNPAIGEKDNSNDTQDSFQDKAVGEAVFV